MDEQSDNQSWWLRQARHVAKRVNLGWWLDLFVPSLFGVSVAGGVAVLVARTLGIDPVPFLMGTLFGVALAACACLVIVRRRFYRVEDGLVRLESAHRLHNGLTTARTGVGRWPDRVEEPDDHLRWSWQRPASHSLLAVGVLAAAWWFPVQPREADAMHEVEEPVAWRQLEEWMDTLEEEEIVEEAALKQVRREVQQFRAQPMEEWYEHGSLEASDSLREQMRHDVREFQRNLESAFAGVSAMQQFPDEIPESMKKRWQKHMKETLEGLEAGSLQIDQDLLNQLQQLNIDPSKLRPLTPEELKALEEALKKGLKACNQCSGTGTNDVLVLVESLCQGGPGTRGGKGGISRGPGTVPLDLRERATMLRTSNAENVRNDDLSRAALGDTLAVTEKEHEIDEDAYQGPEAAGAVESRGEGGEAVWQQPLDPDERKVVQEYFQ